MTVTLQHHSSHRAPSGRQLLCAALLASTAIVALAPAPARAVPVSIDEPAEAPAAKPEQSTPEDLVIDGTNETVLGDGSGTLPGSAEFGDITIVKGSLSVSGGGALDAGQVAIGTGGKSVGTLTISGTGSRARLLDVFVGSEGVSDASGNGKLNVTDGAYVYSYGGLRLDKGAVTVSGSGSTFMSGGGLSVDSGELNVLDGAVVVVGTGPQESSYSDFTDIDGSGSGRARVTVSGAGSKLRGTDYFGIGMLGDGEMVIQGGGLVEGSRFIRVGEYLTGVGVVTISGAGSKLHAEQHLMVGGKGAGTVSVNTGGVVEAAEFALAVDSGSTGTLNIGAAEGEGPLAAGRVQGLDGAAADIRFGEGDGRLVFNHTDAAYTFDARLSGNGTLSHLAGLTRFTGDGSGFAGVSEIAGGTFLIDSTLGGTVTVGDGGSLGGRGTAGDIAFETGAHYRVDLADTQFLTSTGGVTIADGADVVLVSTDRAPGVLGEPFTILTADDGITGQFAGVVEDLVFFDGALGYEANSVLLTLARNGVTFGDVALTRNQRAAAHGVDSLDGGALTDAMLWLSEADVRSSLDAVSGEIHASVKSGLVADSQFIRDVANERLRDIAAGDYVDLGGWGQAYGGWTGIDGDGNAARVKQNSQGVVTGNDAMVGDWRVGVLAGYGHSNLSVDDRSSDASIDSYTVGLYGSRSWDGLNLRGGLSYGWHDISVDRSVTAGSLENRLTTDYGVSSLQAFGELGYSVPSELATFEPFVGLANVSLISHGYHEQGGDAALSGGSQTTNVTIATLGLRAQREMMVGEFATTLHGMAGWRYAFGDVAQSARHGFASGDPFTVFSPDLDTPAVVDAGLDIKIDANTTLGLSYSGQFGEDGAQHVVKGNLSMRF